MRYIFDTKDDQGIIGIQIDKWKKEKKIELIEKAEPVVEIKARLEKIARAINTLEKAGWNKEIMEIYINKKTGVSMTQVRAVAEGQQRFFEAIGVKLE